MKTFLCYYKAWIGDESLYIHALIDADSGERAMEQMVNIYGNGYRIVPKGCLGEFELSEAKKYMNNDQYVKLFAYLARKAGEDKNGDV